MPRRDFTNLSELNTKFNILDAKHDFPNRITIRGNNSYTIEDSKYKNMKKGFDTCLSELFKGANDKGIPSLQLFFSVISAKNDIPSTVSLVSKPSILEGFEFGIQDTVTPAKFGLEQMIGPSHYFDTASHKYGTEESNSLVNYYNGRSITTDLNKFGINGDITSEIIDSNIHFDFRLNGSTINFTADINNNGDVINGIDVINGNANFAIWLEENISKTTIDIANKNECKRRILGKLLGDLYYLIDMDEIDDEDKKSKTLVCTKDSYLCDRVLFNQIGGGVLFLRGIKGNDIWGYGEEGVDNPDGVLLIDLYNSEGKIKSRTNAGSIKESGSSILYYVLYDSARLAVWDATYGGSKHQIGGDGKDRNIHYNQCSVDDLVGEIRIVIDKLKKYGKNIIVEINVLLELVKTKLTGDENELNLDFSLDPVEFNKSISIFVPAQLLFQNGETLEPTLEPKIFPFLSDDEFKKIFGEKQNVNPLALTDTEFTIIDKPDGNKLWNMTKKIIINLTKSDDLKLSTTPLTSSVDFTKRSLVTSMDDLGFSMPNGSENPSLNETNASIIGQGSSGSQLPPRSPNQFGGVRTKSSNSTNTFVDEKELTNNTKAEEFVIDKKNIKCLYKLINSLIEAGYFDPDQFIIQLFLELTNQNEKAAYSFYYLLRGLMFFDGYYIIDILGLYEFIQLVYNSTTKSFTIDIGILAEYLHKISDADKATSENDKKLELIKSGEIIEDLKLIKSDEIINSLPAPPIDVSSKKLDESLSYFIKPPSAPEPSAPEPSALAAAAGGKRKTLKKRRTKRTKRSKSKQTKNKKTRRYKKTP